MANRYINQDEQQPFIPEKEKKFKRGLNEKKFSGIMLVISILLLIFTANLNPVSVQLMLSKLSNVAMLLASVSAFFYFYDGRRVNSNAKVAKHPLGFSVFVGLLSVAIAIVIAI